MSLDKLYEDYETQNSEYFNSSRTRPQTESEISLNLKKISQNIKNSNKTTKELQKQVQSFMRNVMRGGTNNQVPIFQTGNNLQDTSTLNTMQSQRTGRLLRDEFGVEIESENESQDNSSEDSVDRRQQYIKEVEVIKEVPIVIQREVPMPVKIYVSENQMKERRHATQNNYNTVSDIIILQKAFSYSQKQKKTVWYKNIFNFWGGDNQEAVNT